MATPVSNIMTEFDIGEPVIVYAPAFYREPRIGFFTGSCKDHDGAFRVQLLDKNAPIREVCADLKALDTIERLPTTE